jgi:hypothetical protein
MLREPNSAPPFRGRVVGLRRIIVRRPRPSVSGALSGGSVQYDEYGTGGAGAAFADEYGTGGAGAAFADEYGALGANA